MRVDRLFQDKRIGASETLQSVGNIILVSINFAGQVATQVFASRNASDLVGGIGKKLAELLTALAIALYLGRTGPIGGRGWWDCGGRFEPLAD